MTTGGCRSQPQVVGICLSAGFRHTRNRRHDTAQNLRSSVTSTLVIAPPDPGPRPPLAAVGEVNSVTAGRRHRVFPTELDHAVVPPGPAARIAAAPCPAAPAVTVPPPRAHRSPGPGPAAPSGRVISPSTPQPPQLGDEPPVYDDGGLRITRSPAPSPAPGYALAGEIDESTVRGLAAKLAELAANLDEVHLDLGALAYSDLAGLRVIVQLAAGRRRSVLHRVPPHLRAVLAIVGWDTAPGLEFAS